MKNPATMIRFAAICLCAFSFSALAGRAAGFPLDSLQLAPGYTLAKASASSDLRACKARCRKDYRRCYSEGNQVGKPYETGGQPCSEQKVECMRACQQQQQ